MEARVIRTVDLEQVMTELRHGCAARAGRPFSAPVVEYPAERAPATTSLHALVGKGSTLARIALQGRLVADEDLVIQGQVEGSICTRVHDRCQGRVLGDIRARIVVEGFVDGNLYALESVSLRSGAIVRGYVSRPES